MVKLTPTQSAWRLNAARSAPVFPELPVSGWLHPRLPGSALLARVASLLRRLVGL